MMVETGRNENKGGFLRAVKTIGWAFFGVRGRKGHERDLQLHPMHVILVGLVLAAVFIVALVVIANLAVG